MTTLSNGLRVISERMPHVRSVSWHLGVHRLAARNRERNGISHFIEHMLFKGTTSRSAEAIARSMDSIGGNLDAFTGKELVCFNTKVLDEHLSRAFDCWPTWCCIRCFATKTSRKKRASFWKRSKMEADSPDYLVQEIFSPTSGKTIRWASRSWARPRPSASSIKPPCAIIMPPSTRPPT